MSVSAAPDYDGGISTTAYTAHGEYVFYDWASSLPADQGWQADILAKSVQAQGPMIDRFPVAPVTDLPNLPIDIASVLV